MILKGLSIMKLYFRQRLFSWLDSYDIYDEAGNTFCTVRGQLSWGHCLKLFDSRGHEIGMVKERLFTFLPKFELYLAGRYVGCISKEFTFLHPKYNIDFRGWHVEGSVFEWDYTIFDHTGMPIAQISKELFHWTDTYVIEVDDQNDALCALMLVLAIDAEKCSRNS